MSSCWEPEWRRIRGSPRGTALIENMRLWKEGRKEDVPRGLHKVTQKFFQDGDQGIILKVDEHPEWDRCQGGRWAGGLEG